MVRKKEDVVAPKGAAAREGALPTRALGRSVELDDITPSAPVAAAAGLQIPIAVSVNGHYFALQHFFRILRSWAAAHRYGNATTHQFVALAESVSGRDLGHFFHVWLYEPGKPPRGSW